MKINLGYLTKEEKDFFAGNYDAFNASFKLLCKATTNHDDVQNMRAIVNETYRGIIGEEKAAELDRIAAENRVKIQTNKQTVIGQRTKEQAEKRAAEIKKRERIAKEAAKENAKTLEEQERAKLVKQAATKVNKTKVVEGKPAAKEWQPVKHDDEIGIQ